MASLEAGAQPKVGDAEEAKVKVEDKEGPWFIVLGS
jgi:hypothetical protein